jgi:hypothetical protein
VATGAAGVFAVPRGQLADGKPFRWGLGEGRYACGRLGQAVTKQVGEPCAAFDRAGAGGGRSRRWDGRTV